MNGDVIIEPAMEQTSTGRKIRLAGTTAPSLYRKDTEKLVAEGLDRAAKRKRTAVWMPLDIPANSSATTVLQTALGYSPESERRAKLNMTGRRLMRSRAWWSFRHKDLPIEAVLTITLNRAYSSETGFRVTTTLAAPFTLPSTERLPEVLIARDSTLSIHANKVGSAIDDAAKATLEKFIKSNPADYAEILTQQEGLLERAAVTALLRQVHLADGLASIEIPDLRDPDNPRWLTLDLHDTNFNGQYVGDITEYLDGSTATERAAELYEELVDTLRGCGLVVPTTISGTDFMQALLTDDSRALTVQLGKANVGGKEQDAFHVLSIHLPTGTFVVTCKREVEDKNETALEWEKSLIRSEVTGQKDALLTYAEQYATRGHDTRAKTIIRKRQELLIN